MNQNARWNSEIYYGQITYIEQSFWCVNITSYEILEL